MTKKLFGLGILIIVVLAVGGYYFEKNISKEGSNSPPFNTFVASNTSAFPGLSFSYPSNLGGALIKTPLKLSLDLGFKESPLHIVILKDNFVEKDESFQQWVKTNYGYDPKSTHNTLVANDPSIASFTFIAGYEAVKIEAYLGDQNHSLYLLNLGNGSVLLFAIQDAPLALSMRDQIANSIKIK